MLLATLLALVPLAQKPLPEPPGALRVMSFNIRYGTAKDRDNRWENRRELVAATVLRHAPAVVGLQEALADQLAELRAALPDAYRFLGQGRRGGDKDEHASLLVDTRRLEVLEHGDFWLSPTPDKVGSKGWDAALPRICTWARLRDRIGGEQIVVLNAHFDHRGERARVESARLIATHVRRWHHLPVLVTGDLNVAENTRALDVLRAAGLRDTFRDAHAEATDVGTFHGFKGGRAGGKIDYVLATAHWRTHDAAIDSEPTDGRYPSDHHPVTATVSIAERVALMPVLAGDFHHITGAPKLLGEVDQAQRQMVDHAIFRAGDGTWNVWACVRYTRVGRVLYHWRGGDLGSELEDVGVAMRADRDAGESIEEEDGMEWIQAPFVFPHGTEFRMLYGGHRSESGASQICLATSGDGVTFERHKDANGRSRVFVGPGEARDPVVIRIGDLYHCYYCGHDEGEPAPCKVYCRTSPDLLTWSEPTAVNWGGSAGDGRWSAECPFVIEHRGFYYLLRTSSYTQRLTHVYRSTDPLDFGKGDDTKKIGTIRVAAPEIVRDGDDFKISSVHDLRGGIQLAPLRWIPEDQAVSARAFDTRFTSLWDFENGALRGWKTKGKAFANQPVARSALLTHPMPNAVEGDFLISSDDNQVGELRSPTFELPDGRISLRVSGAREPEKLYVVLCLAKRNRELYRATGRFDRILERVVWDVAEHAGEKAYIKIVDDVRRENWGHIDVDDIRVEKTR